MRHTKIVFLSLLLAARVGITTAQAQSDSTSVQNDSITWNKELDGVVIKAQKQLIKQEIDRIAYDVQADEESKTQTVMDMLRKVPMVTVDGQDNILVKGNSNFKIYKNGHYDPNLSKNAKEVLKAMSASMVKRIEVITDPGAREDAEGVDAILNIVMVDGSKMQGMTGVVSATYTSLNHPNFYTSLTGQMGKLLMSVDYGYGGMSNRETEGQSETDRTYLDTGNRMLSHSEGTNPGGIHYTNLNASYDIDSLNLLSASFGGYFYKLNVQSDNWTTLSASSEQLIYRYANHCWMPGYNHHSWNGQFDFEHKTRRKGERLTLSLMLALTRQHTDQENIYTEQQNVSFPYTGNLMTERERFTEYTLQADWLRPLGKGHQLEVGTKYIDRNNNSQNTQEFYGTDMMTSDEFRHTTRVLAAYADYIYNHEKWSARAGLRYEYSFMQGSYPDGSHESFNKHLVDWVPQATLKYQLTDAQSLKLNYTTSINRPGISYLNPAVVTSPVFVQQGNPQLSSSHTQRISLIYSYILPQLTLQIAPAFNFSSGGISSVQTAKDDIRYFTYDNILRYRRFSIEQYVQWKPFDATTLVINNNLRYEHNENPNLGYRTFGWSDNYYVDLSQQLPWKLRLNVSVYGKIGHSPSGIYYMQYSYYDYYASLQRSFLKDDRLTVRLGANTPFNKYMTSEAETVNGDYRDYQIYWNRGRSFSLSVTWRFGSLKASVKKTERSIDNDDVVGGITKGQ
ncbi:MAG: TonB-dependent receptor family protein [Prevotella sp.]|nr:TonB-dependent receptor family protein [Prevotella sp.]